MSSKPVHFMTVAMNDSVHSNSVNLTISVVSLADVFLLSMSFSHSAHGPPN